MQCLQKSSRKTLLDTLASVSKTSGGARAVLLLDQHTTRVLSACVKVSQLYDVAPEIALVDSVQTARAKRAPAALASMDAIYLLTPTEHSVRSALADFAPGTEAAYSGSVHFVFTRRLPDALLDLVRASPAVGRVRTLRELHLDFVALRANAFSLDAPSALRDLFGPRDPGARAAELQRLAEQVATLFATLGQRPPRVRYSADGHPVGRAFAERLSSVLTSAPAASEPNPSGSVLLVLDRSFDTTTPLLQDFSLEALAEALGVLRNGRFVRPGGGGGDDGGEGGGGGGTSSSTAAASSPAGKEVLLENDTVWSRLRLLPFERASPALRDLTEEFLTQNVTAVRAQRGEALSASQQQDASRTQLAFSFVKRRDQLKVAEELISAVTGALLGPAGKTELYARLLLEQDLATQRELDGSEIRRADAAERLETALGALREQAAADAAEAAALLGPVRDSEEAISRAAPALERGERAQGEQRRLLALAAACHRTTQAELAAALAASSLRMDDHMPALRTLTYLNALDARRAGAEPEPRAWDRGAPWHRGAAKAAAAADSQVELSRHVPKLKPLLEAALRRSLIAADWPFADGAPPDAAAAAPGAAEGPGGDGAGGSRSGRAAAPVAARAEPVGSWAFRRRVSSSAAEGGGSGGGATAPRLYVLMLGGASHAELRCAAEAGGGGRVAFGCTELFTPLGHLAAMEEAGATPPPCASFGTR